MKRITILLLFLLAGITTKAQTNLTLNANLINTPDVETVALENAVNGVLVATAPITNDKFTLKASIDETNFYKLTFNANYYLILIFQPDEEITLTIDFENFYSPKIEGSEQSVLIYSMFDGMRSFDERLDSITQIIQSEKESYLRKEILDNKNSLATLFFYDELDIENHLDVYKELEEALSAKYPDNELVKELSMMVATASELSVGSLAPEITLPSPQGEEVSLSSLRGEYVLIDFWASWCAPCRRENPNVVKLYETYHDKGFEIFGVSLDANKDDWLNAIEDDNLSWIHVSDLKYWSSSVVDLYGIEGIPFTVLVGPDGEIIAKNLRGEALEEKLSEIFDK